MEGILFFIGGVVLFVGIIWFLGEVVRPLLQLQRLIRELAEGQKPKGFVARGAWGLEESIGQLERVATRLEGVTSQGESERVNLKAILGSLTEGVLVSDREGKIVLANGQFLRMFDLEDVPWGRTVMEATRLIEVDRAVEEINEAGGMRGLEVQVPGSDSRQAQTFAVNTAAIVEGNQERSGVVVVFHDLSKLRRL
jgi:signal transduction histidine kinase